MGTLGADIKHALRILRQSPGFTATAVAALALGIGANTAIFTVINTVLLKPLPFPEPNRIVQLMGTSPAGNFEMTNVPRFNAWREQNRILEYVTAYDWNGAGINLTGGNRPEQLKGKRVSREYFQVFGARVALGRTFTADEDRPGSGHFVVISSGLWQRRFHSDPNIVGKAISLGGEPHTVVGVLGGAFAPDPPADVWLPLQADPNSTDESTYFLWAAARLKPGVTLERAKAGLKLAAAEYRSKFPKDLVPANSFTAVPLREAVTGDVRPALLVLLGAVACVLFIACANVANLLLARAAGRSREIAIRSALGASRSRIIRQLLNESLILSLIGGGLGLVVGTVGIRALLALNPGNIPRIGLDGMAITLDWRVLVFTLLASLITGTLFGLVPALHAARRDVNSALKEGGSRTGGGRQNRTRSLMVIAEMALAMVLLVAAGLLIRTFTALRTVAPGVDAHNVLTMQTSLMGRRFNQTAAIAGTVQQCEEHLEAIPGVQAVAAADSLPLEFGLGMAFNIQGRPLTNGKGYHAHAIWHYVTHRYFDVFKIPILRGRGFTIRDDSAAPRVAVISESMARYEWPRENPLGQRISLYEGGPDGSELLPREIVGIVGDVHDAGPHEEAGNIMYVPLPQVGNGLMAMTMSWYPLSWGVRTAVAPALVSRAIQREIQETADLPLANIRSMEQLVHKSTARDEFNALLLGIFAFMALLLASIGLFGLMAYVVKQRTLEFGIRLALGANLSNLRNMIVRQAMTLAVTGILIGLAAAFALTRLMAGLLYGVNPIDPLVFSSVPVLLSLVALLASYLPARSTVRLNPLEALRHD